MPISWSADKDRALLLNVITVLSPSPPNWEDVAHMMGAGYTNESLRQRYQKLRKDANEVTAAGGEGTNSLATVATAKPRKRKVKDADADGSDEQTAKVQKKTPRKRKAKDVDADEKNAEDKAEQSVKDKIERRLKTPKLKTEAVDEDEEA